MLFGGPAAHTFCDVFLAMLCEVLVGYLRCPSGHSGLVGVREAWSGPNCSDVRQSLFASRILLHKLQRRPLFLRRGFEVCVANGSRMCVHL